jgi:hypothetical protein
MTGFLTTATMSEFHSSYLHQIWELMETPVLAPINAGYMFPLVKKHKKFTWRWVQSMCGTLKQVACNVVFGILSSARHHAKEHCLAVQDTIANVHNQTVKLWFLTATWEEVKINLPDQATHMWKGDMERMYENMELIGKGSVLEADLEMWRLANHHVEWAHGREAELHVCTSTGKWQWAHKYTQPAHNTAVVTQQTVEQWITLDLTHCALTLGGSVFTQKIGCPMGDKNSGLHATNREQISAHNHITALIHIGEWDLATSFSKTFIVADDYFILDCPEFEHMAHSFCPAGLNLKDKVVEYGMVHSQHTGIQAHFLSATLTLSKNGDLDYNYFSKATEKGLADNRTGIWRDGCNHTK